MKQVIYSLSDPRDHKIRYVGYTKNLFQRIQYHYMQTPNKRGNRCSTFEWLVELCDLGLLPEMKVVEEIAEDASWEDREKFWISYYVQLGEPLLNRTLGGRPGGWSWRHMRSEALTERRKRQSELMREISKKYWADKSPEQRTELMRSRGRRTHELHPDHLRTIGLIGGQRRWRKAGG